MKALIIIDVQNGLVNRNLYKKEEYEYNKKSKWMF